MMVRGIRFQRGWWWNVLSSSDLAKVFGQDRLSLHPLLQSLSLHSSSSRTAVCIFTIAVMLVSSIVHRAVRMSVVGGVDRVVSMMQCPGNVNRIIGINLIIHGCLLLDEFVIVWMTLEHMVFGECRRFAIGTISLNERTNVTANIDAVNQRQDTAQIAIVALHHPLFNV